MDRTFVAPNPNAQTYRPAYKVTKLEGKVERTILKKNEATKKFVAIKVEEPAGFMLEGMKRHHAIPVNSIRVKTVAELIRLGVSETVPLIGADGEQVGVAAL